MVRCLVEECCFFFSHVPPSAVLTLENIDSNLVENDSSFDVSGDQDNGHGHQVAPSGHHESPIGLF